MAFLSMRFEGKFAQAALVVPAAFPLRALPLRNAQARGGLLAEVEKLTGLCRVAYNKAVDLLLWVLHISSPPRKGSPWLR
jgi:hypothetical protein